MRVLTLVAMAIAICFTTPAWADMGAPDPISLDRLSPSIVDFPASGNNPANIYDMPNNQPMPPALPLGLDFGGPGPVVHTFDWEYGLTPQDNNDGHSNGETTDPWEERLMFYFSGDENSIGMRGTDYDNQAQLQQAAGDRFMVNGITDRAPLAAMFGGPAMIIQPLPFPWTSRCRRDADQYPEREPASVQRDPLGRSHGTESLSASERPCDGTTWMPWRSRRSIRHPQDQDAAR